MRGTWISRLRAGAKALLRDQRGNAFMLTAAAIVPVIGIVGSAVDIGRAYMTQLRLQQACDSGVLAGRRAMGGATYSEAAQAEANKMFNFNFPEAKYGASGILFSSWADDDASDVSGQASAVIPTELMFLFGKDQFRLSANCTAKLEISNVDVMMVLDVTGSMAETIDSGDDEDDQPRIEALHTAAIDFFDTLTNADVGDGRLRFGVVPYSSSANVGAILYGKNPAWLADTVRLPSRKPVTKEVWEDESIVVSEDYTVTTPVPDRNRRGEEIWESAGLQDSANTETKCNALAPWADDGNPEMIDIDDQNPEDPPVVEGSTRITVYDSERTYRYYSYKYAWKPGKRGGGTCQISKLRWTFVRTYQVTETETLTKVFDNKYSYEDITFPVADVKNGTTALVTDVGDYGQSQSNIWSGCVIERQTTDFDDDDTAPAEALDMDIDTPPSGDIATQWRLLIPEIAFARASHPSYKPSTSGARVVNSSDVTLNNKTKGNWQNYSKYWADGWGVCPAPAMNLTEMTKDDKEEFENYIESLQPLGGTYHDAGMVWGVRLLSPTGLFKDENAEADNKRPISRHIVFMTDGAMAPNMGNLGFQGYEYLMHRVGGSDDAALRARHNNRFLQLCRAARQRGITVWVVSFGVNDNANLNSCASSGQAFEADNAAELNQQFQAIARQISKLRLSQ